MMSWRTWALMLTAVGLLAMVRSDAAARPGQAPAPAEGVEVLARGPVHEAFAQVADVEPQVAPVVPQQPPAPLTELPPSQRPEGENVRWIPGYWAWGAASNRFLWVSGVWRNPPPGRQWVPGHWARGANGWQWVNGVWVPLTQTELVILPPPPALPAVETPPAAPSPASVWVPCCWVYQQARYLWRPGFWMTSRPDWVWTPAHYTWVPGGCVFVEGHWDYPLETRGLLFAPVRVAPAFLARPNWTYVPQYVVHTDNLLKALFVRTGSRHYYFGDFFDDRYRKEGFVSWMDARVQRHGFDPLFSYYRHRPEGERWEHEMRGVYEARLKGRMTRPATTLTQQTEVIKRLQEAPTSAEVIREATVVHPLGHPDSRAVRLREVTPEHRSEITKSVEWSRQVQREREAHAVRVAPQGVRPVERTTEIRETRLTLPPSPHRAAVAVKTPPLPELPRHVERR